MNISLLILLTLSMLQWDAKSQMLSSTKQLERAVVHGELTLDAEDEGVFDELYRLLSRADPAHPLFVNNELWQVDTKFFLAWTSLAGAKKSDAGAVDRKILKFRDASIKDILEKVAKTRGLTIVDLSGGWLFVFPEARVVERDAVITEEEAEKADLILFLAPPGPDLAITNATAFDLVHFINTSLRGKKLKKGIFEVKRMPENGSEKPENGNVLLSVRGLGKYIHLLHIYGIIYRAKFAWTKPDVLQEFQRIN